MRATAPIRARLALKGIRREVNISLKEISRVERQKDKKTKDRSGYFYFRVYGRLMIGTFEMCSVIINYIITRSGDVQIRRNKSLAGEVHIGRHKSLAGDVYIGRKQHGLKGQTLAFPTLLNFVPEN